MSGYEIAIGIIVTVAVCAIYAAYRWGYEVARQDCLALVEDGSLVVSDKARHIQPSTPWPKK